MRAPALLSTPAPRPAPPAAAPGPSDPDRWADAGVEPSVDDLMADPLTALVMRRDHIGPADVLAAVNRARHALRRAADADEPATPAQCAPVPFVRPPVQIRPMMRHDGFQPLPLVSSL